MRAADVVDQLAAVMPLHTDGFSESLDLLSITVAGTTASATSNGAHNLVDGQIVAITGATAPAQIDTATFLRTGSTATFETLQDHDLTLSERDIGAGGKTIRLIGATEAEFNGTFSLLRVVNRRKLIIAVADAGPTTISGAPIVEDANGGVFNGAVAAAVTGADTFDYELPIAYPLPAVTTAAKVQTEIRIAAVADVDTYVRHIFTAKNPTDDTLVVQLGDVSLSKKRNEESDAASSASGEYAYSPLLLQPFAVYIIMNVTDDLTAATARDKVEAEYVPAIFRALSRAQFDTGFTYSEYRATFTGHGVYAYATPSSQGRALYVHEVAFEQLAQLTSVDMAVTGDSVAMRDVDYTITTNLGTGELSAAVDLDEEPLP